MGSGSSQHAGSIPLSQLNGDLYWSHYAIQGKRDSMEDEFVATAIGNHALFGVFDGHYGKKAATFASQNIAKSISERKEFINGDVVQALSLGFQDLDKSLLAKSKEENWHDGTTALVALLGMTHTEPNIPSSPLKSPILDHGTTPNPAVSSSNSNANTNNDQNAPQTSNQPKSTSQLRLYIANAGDCRAISCYGDGRTFQLTTDHNPTVPFERYRIFKAGGNIKMGRIEAKLSVSRGFGDRQFKEPKYLVSAIPEVISFPIHPELRFVVLACDGVWGWLSNTQVAQFVAKQLKQGSKPEAVCKDLVKYAYDAGSTDNISVILLYFAYHRNEDRKNGSSEASTSISVNTKEKKKNGPPVRADSHPAPDSIRSPNLSQNNTTGSLSKVKTPKVNFSTLADSVEWNLSIDMIDKRVDKAETITTHISTGSDIVYLDASEFDSTTSDLSSRDVQLPPDLFPLPTKKSTSEFSPASTRKKTTSKYALADSSSGSEDEDRESSPGTSTSQESDDPPPPYRASFESLSSPALSKRIVEDSFRKDSRSKAIPQARRRSSMSVTTKQSSLTSSDSEDEQLFSTATESKQPEKISPSVQKNSRQYSKKAQKSKHQKSSSTGNKQDVVRRAASFDDSLRSAKSKPKSHKL